MVGDRTSCDVFQLATLATAFGPIARLKPRQCNGGFRYWCSDPHNRFGNGNSRRIYVLVCLLKVLFDLR